MTDIIGAFTDLYCAFSPNDTICLSKDGLFLFSTSEKYELKKAKFRILMHANALYCSRGLYLNHCRERLTLLSSASCLALLPLRSVEGALTRQLELYIAVSL